MKLYNRKYVLAGLTILVSVTFIAKLFHMQILDDKAKKQASEITQAQIIIEPARGLIYDRNGQILVDNQPVYNLMVIPREVSPMDDTLAFCNLLKIDKKEFKERLSKAQNYSYHRASRFASKISRADFAILSEQLHKYPGFFAQQATMRHYPRKIGAHVLGDIAEVSTKELKKDEYYRMGDDIGKGGLELQYEEELRGEKGLKYIYRNNLGVLKEKSDAQEKVSAQVGDEIISTLDAQLQEYGESLMANKRGCIVAIEPKTGEILCLVSAPHFDPNDLVGKKRGENFGKLNTDTLEPLFNRAIKGQYRPGSIFKMVQALIALEDSIVVPQTRIYCNRGLIGCHGAHSNDNLGQAIQHSCNPYFREVMRRIVENNDEEGVFRKAGKGLDEWNAKIKRFGFGSNLGLDLPGVKSGMIPSSSYFNNIYGANKWAYSNIYSISIGEGENQTTPLQMANLAAIIANKGHYITPHLVRSMNGVPQFTSKDHYNSVGVKSKHFDVVREAMRTVVEEPGGTARRARVPDVVVCGKTGTVQNDPKLDHSVFIAFAPMDDPQIAIAVYVESAGFGGTWAAPIASLMIEKKLKGEITMPYKEERILEAELKYNE